jgi:signal peptidase I
MARPRVSVPVGTPDEQQAQVAVEDRRHGREVGAGGVDHGGSAGERPVQGSAEVVDVAHAHPVTLRVTVRRPQEAGLSDPELIDDERPTGMAWVADVARTWLPAILAVLVIRTYVFEPFRIPSGSMVPTLQIGDHVVVNKASYGLWLPITGVEIPFMELAWVPTRFEVLDWGDPERGDIIVFRFPKNEQVHYIKRVVGIPGDKIRVRNNQIFLNGEEQPRRYVDRYSFVDDNCIEQTTKRYIETLDGHEHEKLTNLGLAGPLGTFPRGTAEIEVPEDMVFVMGDNRDNSQDSRSWKFVRYDQIKGKAHFVWFSWDGCGGSMRPERFFRSLYKVYNPDGTET